jgi:hypothetical protein
MVDRPDFRVGVVLVRDDDEARIVGIDAIDHHAVVVQRVVVAVVGRPGSLWLVGRSGLGLVGTDRRSWPRRVVANLLLAIALFSRRNVDVEARELDVIDVLAPDAEQAAVDMKLLDGDERRQVGARAAPADAEVGAFGAERG